MIRRSVLIVPATIESALIDLIFAASIVASAILAFVTAPSWIAAEPMEPSLRTPLLIHALFTFARSISAFLATRLSVSMFFDSRLSIRPVAAVRSVISALPAMSLSVSISFDSNLSIRPVAAVRSVIFALLAESSFTLA